MGRTARSGSFELGSYDTSKERFEEGDSWRTPWKRLSRWEWVCLSVFGLIPVVCGSVIGALSSTSSYVDRNFAQPTWRPPPALFGPAWAVLYLLIGLASVLVYVYGGGLHRRTAPPLFLFALQLLLNFAWTPTFFGLGYANAGVVVISAMWGVTVACIVTFLEHSVVGALLLLPYLAWLSFATALNYSIVCLNGSCILPPAAAATTTSFFSTTATQ